MNKLGIFIFCVFILSACNEDSKEESVTTSPKGVESAAVDEEHLGEAAPEEVEEVKTEKVISWVDNLNIREEPNTGSKTITQLKENEVVTFAGEKTDFVETRKFRGKLYTSSWIKITTNDGKTGWAFGGALKREGDVEGTPMVKYIDFEHFGPYNLNKWHKSAEHSGGEGDADYADVTYISSEGLGLKINKTEMYEYGYSRSYELRDANGKLLKSRKLEYTTDPITLTEEVHDYVTKKVYTRSEELKKSSYQLKYQPETVNSTFKESDMETEEINKFRPKAVTVTEVKDCFEEDDGCSCGFRGDKNDANKSNVFSSDMGENACINLDGQEISLTGGQIDKIEELETQSYMKTWIELSPKNIKVFGKPVDFKTATWYDDTRDEIVKTLSVMDQLPQSIPVTTKGTVGMGVRGDFRDIADEALAIAKTAKAKGDKGVPTEFLYKNKEYSCQVVANNTGRDDGGGLSYEGYMILSKNGIEIWRTKVNGYCGC